MSNMDYCLGLDLPDLWCGSEIFREDRKWFLVFVIWREFGEKRQSDFFWAKEQWSRSDFPLSVMGKAETVYCVHFDFFTLQWGFRKNWRKLDFSHKKTPTKSNPFTVFSVFSNFPQLHTTDPGGQDEDNNPASSFPSHSRVEIWGSQFQYNPVIPTNLRPQLWISAAVLTS